MPISLLLRVITLAAVTTLVPFTASAQVLPLPGVSVPTAPSQPEGPTTSLTVCDLSIPPPATLPPAGSAPVVYLLIPCFERQDNVSLVPPETYVFYLRLPPSQPSQGLWVPFDEDARQTIREDFWRLWDTSWLEDLSIEVFDYVFANGVVGKVVTYNIEERQRIRVVDYEGSDEIDRTAIDEQLTALGIQMNFDTFLDVGQVEQVEAVVRNFMAEKGFNNAVVDHTINPTAAGPKIVNVTFTVEQGPKTRIREVEFVGNVAFADRQLRGQLQQNKPAGMFAFLTGGGTYKVNQYEQDVAALMQYYRNRGYAKVSIGQPELRVLETEEDGETEWVQLRIPVTEGSRYRLGRLDFNGNTVVPSDFMRPLFELEGGEWYSEEELREGLTTAQEVYGSAGYMNFTGIPDLRFTDDADAIVPAALLASPGSVESPTVNVTMRLTEGEQFRVNRITFEGNTTTHDSVIRREFRLVEGGVYDTQALDFSLRRINQLGYFDPVEVDGENLTVERIPGEDDVVDITLRLQEQDRNQLTFGAGVSQYEGFFGQLSFQTANFLGRGESLTVSLQGGARSQNYQLAFSEPFLFDRNITGGFDLYKRELQYIGFYTQKTSGANVTFGFPTIDFSRMFVNYSYEQAEVTDLNEGFNDPMVLARNPFLTDSLLLGNSGQRTISKVTPSFVYNTIDNPIFPNAGTQFSADIGLAGFGGNTSYYKPSFEAVWFRRHTSRTSVGFRIQTQYIAPFGDTETLPIFEKLFLGGEYTIRGYDIRSVGPSDPVTGLVLGGNKSLLFNAEYIFQVSDPMRIIVFYDAGQVRDQGQPFSLREDLLERVVPKLPLLVDPFQQVSLTRPGASLVDFQAVGKTSAFKTSTGLELRFFMPVLNVPFRLIWSRNFQRGNVLDNSLQPAESNAFKFAVGTTF
jgi:outer membrane protein insertion porin family